jgi:chromosome segregation ATPase
VQSTPPQVNNEQETEEIRRLQDQLTSTNMQLKQLDEANRAWQQYQQNQLVLLRDRLKLTDMENSSFEDIVQQIENRLNDLNDQVTELEDVKSKFFFSPW